MADLQSPNSPRQYIHLITRETAAAHATIDVPIVSSDASAGTIRGELQARRFASAADVAVCDGGRLLGLIRIEDVLAAADNVTARALMDADPPIVYPGEDQEVAAWKAVRHGEGSLAVVDEKGLFLGLVPPPALIDIFLREHDEDMARLGGYLRGTSAARTASEENILRRFWHKIPWLLVGLIGAFISADIVGAFEGRLQENVMLAFFLPGIVYLADAVGTQTETVVIRGLAIGTSVKRFAVREIASGLLVGAVLALVFLPIGLLRWGDGQLVLTVSLSLFAACGVATIIAMALPYALQALGRDPAFGSGPLATVIQDILSIVIYLSISMALK